MKIKINVKGVSNKKNKIVHLIYDYPSAEMTVEEFIALTVRQNVRDYEARHIDSELGEVKVDETKAVRTALQAFEDGITAVFVDGERFTERSQTVKLTPESEATFVKLTFLAGRIW